MSDIGGYYAELALITDGASFAVGRKNLTDLNKEGEKSIEIFNKLQKYYGSAGRTRSTGGTYGEGGDSWRWVGGSRVGGGVGGGGGGGGGGPSGTSGGALPWPSTNKIIGAPEEEETAAREEKKKSALRSIALLYALTKIIQVTEKVVKALWELTGVTAKEVQQTVVSAARAGTTPEQWKRWQSAFNIAGIDFSSFGSSATAFNDAFLKLKKGDPSAFAAMAPSLAQLGLNPGDMVNMTNDQRMRSVFDAAFGMSDKGRARVLLEDVLGTSAGEMFVRPGVSSSKDILALGGGAEKIAVPTAKDVANAADFSRVQEFLKNFKTLLGMEILDAINPEIKKITSWMSDPKNTERIKNAFRGIGRFFEDLLKFLEGIGQIFLALGDTLGQFYSANDKAKAKFDKAKAEGDFGKQLEASAEGFFAILNAPGRLLQNIDQALGTPMPSAQSSQPLVGELNINIQGSTSSPQIEQARREFESAIKEAAKKAPVTQQAGSPKMVRPPR
jgi:hypothetical protein